MTAGNNHTNEPVPDLLQTLQLAVTQGRSRSTGFQSYATTTHKFLLVQGVVYAAVGMLCSVKPSLIADMMLIPSPEALDLAWFRIAGVPLSTIGYFYIQGARQVDVKPFVVTSTFNRMTFVPLMLFYIMFFGSTPQVCLAFAVLDPLLAVLTHHVWVHDMKRRAHQRL